MGSILPLSESAKNFQPGIYRHYKGGLYDAMFVARTEATGEEQVIYKSREKRYIWTRPLAMFMEEVDVDGKTMPRFEFVNEQE
ncbi:MAG: DUF1653 domain-containing protein [bacterium]|nr:DUF1653 domain-containing protein [bacterium]